MAPTVLIVEDEADLGALLTDVLEASGYRVVLTTSSRAAERSRGTQPAVIVTDYLMPGMNGAEVVKEIREALPVPPPPVVLVTGLSNARELAAQISASAYLRKPFDMDEFVSVVDRACRG